MNGAAVALRRAPALPIATSPRDGEGSLTLRLGSFCALATFASAHWVGLVAPAPLWRAVAVVACATAGAAAVALTGRALLGRALLWPLRVAIVLATFAAAAVAIGLPDELLAPAGWDSLAEGIARGLEGTRTLDWPYAGDEPWVRLTLLLAAVPVVSGAAMLAFWPASHGRGALRWAALLLLVALYATAATEHDFGAEPVRGLVLLALVAVWLWLPRLRSRDAIAAATAVAAAGLAGVPLSVGLADERPWLRYQSWSVFGKPSGTRFDWDHDYGLITWPRRGRTLLHVASERPHYWRAEALDSFDGLRWLRTPAQQTAGASVELPAVRNPRWDETIRFRVRALRSDQLLSAGMPYEFHGAGAVSIGADGTAIVRGKRLSSGDAYAVDAYVPEPSAARMRAAPAGYEPYFWHYGDIHLPLPDDPSRREGRPDAAAAGLLYPPVRVELRGGNGSGIPGSEQALLASPYGAVYRLARRLTATAPTTYDAVRNVERHLRRNYRYDERPPQRPYPLRAFLFGDRAGYCQHFSGAMALMLRMAGIPARVAAGFAPGSLDSDSKEYRVRDLDAHSWVEVYFTGIGWVPFDPTPTVAPARSQGGGLDLASAALGDARDSGAAGREGAGDGARAPASERAGDPSPVASTPSGGRDVGTGLALLAGAAFLAVLVAVARGFRARRRAGARAGDPELADLDRLLRRARPPFAAAPTLLALERLLEGESKPRAARCIRRIRLRRFGPRAGPKPLKRERRALRRALRRRRGDGLAVALRFKGS